MSEKVDMKKLQFQSILAAHTVFSVAGHEKTPMTAAADKAAWMDMLCKRDSHRRDVEDLDLLLWPRMIALRPWCDESPPMLR